MSGGISVGDVIAAITLAAQLWTACFSKVSNAQIAYTRYGEQICGLRSSLQNLWEMLSEYESRRRLQRGGQSRVDSAADLNALAIIIGDFEGTLRNTHKLMDKYAIFKKDPSCPQRRGYVARIKWSIDAEQEVQRLTQECSFHMVKIQFALESLKIKIQMELSDQIQETRDELVVRLHRIEGLLRNASQGGNTPDSHLGLNIETGPPNPREEQRRGSGTIAQNLTDRRLEDRFEEKLRYHPKFSDIPIEEWTEAATWWIKMGTAPLREQGTFGLGTVPAELFVNLLKAAWLLSKCEESLVYRRLESNSFWRIHIGRLTQTIEDEIKGITQRGLLLPNKDGLLRLPESCFNIWVKYAEREAVLGSRDEQPGEEKILQLNLETTLNPDRFAKELLIFRKDEGTLRVCVTTEDFDNGSRSSEVFIVKPAEAKLLALYITQYNPFQTSPVLNVIMNNHHQSGEFSFKSLQDLKNFQRAIVGAQVIFDQPGSRGLLCAPTFLSALEGTNVRVQIWLDKPLAKIQPPIASPNPDALHELPGSPLSPTTSSASSANSPPQTPIPTMARTMTTVTSHSASSSGSSSGSGPTHEVIEFRVPTAPRLLVYFKAKNQWKFLQIPIEDKLIIKSKNCCGNHMKRLFAGAGETCCRRTVLEAQKGNIEGLLFSPKKDDPDWSLDILQAGIAHAKMNGDKVTFKYITIEFLDEAEKMRFNRALEGAKDLGKAHKAKVNQNMREAKKQAFVANFGGGADGGHGRVGSISRSRTWTPSESGSMIGRNSIGKFPDRFG